MNPRDDENAAFTDDLSLRVAPGRTLDELVDFVLTRQNDRIDRTTLVVGLTRRFALSFDDARVAIDRVGGGLVRAKTSHPGNRPDATKDPVALIAYRRARGEVGAPAVTSDGSDAWTRLCELLSQGSLHDALASCRAQEFASSATAAESEAAALFCNAVDARGDGASSATSIEVVQRLTSLATCTVRGNASDGVRRTVLMRVGTLISHANERCIDALGERRFADAGSALWFDAIALADASEALGRLFREVGDHVHEDAAADLHGRITTRALGHRHDLVGNAMMWSGRCAGQVGDVARAIEQFDAFIGDVAPFMLESWEPTDEAPFDEHVVVLRQLIEAIGEREALAKDNACAQIRSRIESVLSRT